MRNVTDRSSNPFGMRPPFERQEPGNPPAVFGYGDANADFHLIGDHPGVHGGESTRIPFTDSAAGEALCGVFRDLGFVSGPAERPDLDDLFCSYVHMCALAGSREPTPTEYATLERYFDAELRAINAHILLPVGERATDHVLRTYTTQRHRFGADLDLADLHASELRGRGFLVVPIREPTKWAEGDHETLLETMRGILASDYRQTKGVATRVG